MAAGLGIAYRLAQLRETFLEIALTCVRRSQGDPRVDRHRLRGARPIGGIRARGSDCPLRPFDRALCIAPKQVSPGELSRQFQRYGVPIGAGCGRVPR